MFLVTVMVFLVPSALIIGAVEAAWQRRVTKQRLARVQDEWKRRQERGQ
jgi:Na+/melibiose symporter-like transporter